MKVKLNTVVPTKSKNGKFYQQVNYDNDQKASAWDDDLTPFIGQEVEVEITEKNGYKNVKLVGGVARPAGAAPVSTPAPAPTKEHSEVDTRYKAMILSLEILKSTGATINKQNLLAEAIVMEDCLKNGFPTENKG
jgi:hypothetical protein